MGVAWLSRPSAKDPALDPPTEARDDRFELLGVVVLLLGVVTDALGVELAEEVWPLEEDVEATPALRRGREAEVEEVLVGRELS